METNNKKETGAAQPGSAHFGVSEDNQNPTKTIAQEVIDDAYDAELNAYLQGETPADGKKAKKQKKAKAAGGNHQTEKVLSKAKKMSKKKKVIIGIVVMLLLLLVVTKACGGKTATPIATTQNLVKKDIVSIMSLKGPLSGTENVEVVSNLHSEILSVSVKEGDKVAKGQTLAVLDNETVADEVSQAQNSYDLANSQYKDRLKESQSTYDKANQDYKTAKTNYDRYKALYDQGGISKTELETAQNTMNDAKRQLSTYNVSGGRVVGSSADLQQLQNAQDILKQKQKAYEDTIIKSPIDGTVTRVNAAVGRFANDPEDKKPIFVIENIDNLEMKVSVSEYDIAKLQEGQAVKVFADIMGEDFVDAVVSRISPTGEIKEGAQTTERVIPAIIKLTGTNPKLIAGITARADIVLAEAKGVFVVSSGAVIQQADGTLAVAIIEGKDKVKLIPVTTGIESDIEIEIKAVTEGALTENMQIITNPTPDMVDGTIVTAMPADGGAAGANGDSAATSGVAVAPAV